MEPSHPDSGELLLYTICPHRLYMQKKSSVAIPTGIGRNTLLRLPPGLNAFGTKISGAVLTTLRLMVSRSKHPSAVYALNWYEKFSSSMATGLAMSFRLRCKGGCHS